jgi:hypothetical protein
MEAAALVLDSPFSSAVDVAAVHYRMLPVRWLMFDQFRSDLAIRNVHIPVLIVHGDEDRVTPIKCRFASVRDCPAMAHPRAYAKVSTLISTTRCNGSSGPCPSSTSTMKSGRYFRGISFAAVQRAEAGDGVPDMQVRCWRLRRAWRGWREIAAISYLK